MTETLQNSLKYPIGKFNPPSEIRREDIDSWIKTIEQFPNKLSVLTKYLKEEQLSSTYRPGGWTIRQVIHHCADSHHNSYTRFKWTLTEDKPTIKAYDQDAWANLSDTKYAPVKISLLYLEALHAKWVHLLVSLSDEDLERSFIHPESGVEFNLKTTIAMYAWHCQHHYAHIYNHLKQKKWI